MFYFNQQHAARHYSMGITSFKKKLKSIKIDYWPQRYDSKQDSMHGPLFVTYRVYPAPSQQTPPATLKLYRWYAVAPMPVRSPLDLKAIVPLQVMQPYTQAST
jgi:hypothetical protein